MINRTPLDCLEDTDLSGAVTLASTLSVEVPHAGNCSDDELLKADDESNHPEESEKEEPHSVSGSLVPFNVGNWRCAFEFRLSDTVNMDSSENPEHQENK